MRFKQHRSNGELFVNGSIGGQLLAQATGIIATIVYTGIVSFILLKILDSVMGLRVDEDEEAEGLDVALHDERGYNLSS